MEIFVLDNQRNRFKPMAITFDNQGRLTELILKNNKGEDFFVQNPEGYQIRFFHHPEELESLL